MYILLAILMFGFLIFIHELGHFLSAKLLDVQVNEFAICMGPVLWQKKKGETTYSLRAIPIGGFCAMEGEDEESDNPRAFPQKSWWRRLIILAAGSFMNFVAGFLAIVLLYTGASAYSAPIVTDFFEGCPLESSDGLQVGDEIIEVNGMRIFTTMDMSYQFGNDEDGKFDMVVKRDGKKVELKDVTFATDDNTMHIDFKVAPKAVTVGSVITQSFKQGCTDGRLIYISFADLIRGKYSIKDLSGPVGIVDTIDNVIDSERDSQSGKIDWSSLIDTMLSLGAFMTINIGIFNLLPLPALDGGRLLFLIIEAVRRKPVKPEHEGMVHAIGMAALLLLMVVVTVSDIIKLV